jgi:hypothetical protein
MEEGRERIRQAYGAGKYEPLKTVKPPTNPTNLFRLSQDITPDGTVG